MGASSVAQAIKEEDFKVGHNKRSIADVVPVKPPVPAPATVVRKRSKLLEDSDDD
jgi:hypothetical protein